jgi:hypothetical protein
LQNIEKALNDYALLVNNKERVKIWNVAMSQFVQVRRFLIEHEFIETVDEEGNKTSAKCLACGGLQYFGHEKDCWLAKALYGDDVKL